MMILQMVYWILFILLLARVIIPFTSLSPVSPIRILVHKATEPLLEPIRRFMPPLGGFDISPLILLLLAQLVISLAGRIF